MRIPSSILISERPFARLLVRCLLLGAVTLGAYGVIDRRTFDKVFYIEQFKLGRIERGEEDGVGSIILGDSVGLGMNWAGHRDLYNYSLIYSGGLFNYGHLLDVYLRHKRAPSVVVLVVRPMTFSEDQPFSLTPNVIRWLPLDILLKDIYRRKQWSVLPLVVKSRFDAGNRLIAMLSGEFSSDVLDPATGGYSVPENLKPYLFAPRKPGTFNLSPTSRREFQTFLALAEAHQARVILYFMPRPRHDFEADRKYYGDFEAAIAELIQGHPSVIFCRPSSDADLWPDEYFFDDHHLNARGIRRWREERFPLFYRLLTDAARRPIARREPLIMDL